MKTPYGDRIKKCASIMSALIGVCAIVLSIWLFKEGNSGYYTDDGMILLGIAVLIVGAFMVWVNYVLMSGFGELVKNSEMITAHLGLKEDAENEEDEVQNQDQALEKALKDNDLVYVKYISNGRCSKCGKTSDVEQYQNKKTYEFTYYCEDCIKEM